MSRKDYAFLAEVCRGWRVDQGAGPPEMYRKGWDQGREDAIRNLAHHLRSTNPAFDKARFLKACGLEA